MASIRQAREALLLAMERLQPEDRFEVIEFNSSARALFGSARPASRENLGRALRSNPPAWLLEGMASYLADAQTGLKMPGVYAASTDSEEYDPSLSLDYVDMELGPGDLEGGRLELMEAVVTRDDFQDLPSEFVPAGEMLVRPRERAPLARHRSREVMLYRQGPMNLIVNAHEAKGPSPILSAMAEK